MLGSYHPVVAQNAARLAEISGLDEVSFHMSGTEAVMQAVRLARYHTRRTHVVCFCGAYHGWWGDVQPGIGNPVRAHETYTLKDMSEDALQVLRTRRDIACVLVNPLQALHPNAGAPADSSLVDSSRRAHFDKAAYADWLKRLRAVCTERGIVLIFDEVFVGFRLALGGAQEYFGVQADMVTYGKTLGGGLPIGVVCGRKHLMKRFRDDRPADICFARGTFNSHPYVMAAMQEFLRHLDQESTRELYRDLDEVWNRRAEQLNRRLLENGLPVEVANLSSIWTVCYTQPSRYNWMLQYYLRAEGLALSWIGTGRLIFSLNYTDADFEAVADRFVRAAKAMQRDGWWWTERRNDQQVDQAAHSERDHCPPLFIRSRRRDAVLKTASRHDSRSGIALGRRVRLFFRLLEPLAAQKLERRLVVELDVVERVGEDLRRPDQPGLHVLQEEQLHGAEQQAAEADDEPDLRHVADVFAGIGMRLEDAEQRRIEIERQRRQRPDRQQDDLALEIVADLDLFLVFVAGVVHHVVVLRLEEEVADLRREVIATSQPISAAATGSQNIST